MHRGVRAAAFSLLDDKHFELFFFKMCYFINKLLFGLINYILIKLFYLFTLNPHNHNKLNS
jgi:hypothetical protein